MPERSDINSRIIGSGLSIAALGIVLILADLGLGVAGFPTEKTLPAAHGPHHTQKFGSSDYTFTIRTNSKGIRYREIPDKKAPGEFRVVVLGDSFVEGKGVEEDRTWPSQLEKSIGRRFPEREILFINCGLIGAGPVEYASVLERVGLAYEPDLVLLVFFANDVTHMDLRTYEPRRGPARWLHAIIPRLYTLVSVARDRLKRFLKEIRPKNILKDLIREARRQGRPDNEIEAWRNRLDPQWVQAVDQGRMDAYMLSHALLRPEIWVEALDLSTPLSDRKWRAAESAFARILGLCRNRNTDLAIAYAPIPYQYDPTYVSPSMKLGVRIRKEWLVEESEVERRLEEWASRNGLPFLSMTPAFRREAAQRPGALQFKTDPHWTDEGNRLAARLVEEWLLKDRLV